MTNALPRPEEILEELADKVAAQIERLTPVAFDSAFSEMTGYHRFLLALGASRDSDGNAFNFAEVAGSSWLAPHTEWIRQYRRLFERAADKLVDDSHFVRSLAHAPSRLLPRAGDFDLSPNLIRGILDLGPLLVSRLEAWVSKRSIIETQAGDDAASRRALVGSDAKAYENLLPEIVGAWESLLHHPPTIYSWRVRDVPAEAERWEALRASWPFLWQHLTNTAYCLAIAVWNEDETGAAHFREMLVRWTHALGIQLNDRVELRHRRLLFPSIFELEWSEASGRVAPLGFDYMPVPTPDQLFASSVLGAHNDILLLTAELLLFWTINDKQVTDIGARTAKALLNLEVSDGLYRHAARPSPSFHSLFLDFLRFEMAGARYGDSSYGAHLDQFLGMLDSMTERRVVPMRVYTPSTLQGRHDLVSPELAILLAYLPGVGDDGLMGRIVALADEENVLPERDGSLRGILHQLEQFRLALEQPSILLDRGVELLAPEQNLEGMRARLQEIVAQASQAIEEKRQQRLRERQADPEKLEHLRSEIEKALLTADPEVPFFRGVKVGRASGDDAANWCDAPFSGIGKAGLTEPPMGAASLNLEELLVSGTLKQAGAYAWNAFCQRPRIKEKVTARAEDEAFWRELAPLLPKVGPEPVLVVSRNAEGRALRHFLYAPPEDRPKLSIELRSRDDRGASYIATVEGVDVFGADFPPGKAWLFSAASLCEARYAQTDSSGRYAELTFEIGEEMEGTLRLRFRQVLEWSREPIFELEAPDPGEAAEGQ